jgi:hypothetical protein
VGARRRPKNLIGPIALESWSRSVGGLISLTFEAYHQCTEGPLSLKKKKYSVQEEWTVCSPHGWSCYTEINAMSEPDAAIDTDQLNVWWNLFLFSTPLIYHKLKRKGRKNLVLRTNPTWHRLSDVCQRPLTLCTAVSSEKLRTKSLQNKSPLTGNPHNTSPTHQPTTNDNRNRKPVLFIIIQGSDEMMVFVCAGRGSVCVPPSFSITWHSWRRPTRWSMHVFFLAPGTYIHSIIQSFRQEKYTIYTYILFSFLICKVHHLLPLWATRHQFYLTASLHLSTILFFSL